LAYHLQIDADLDPVPDPAYHFEMDPDPDFYLMRIGFLFNADPGYQNDADTDPQHSPHCSKTQKD
jgi:hypothetical protein